MKSKRIILITLAFLLLATIFYFSHQNGFKSITTSDNFTSKIIDKVLKVTKKNITPEKKKTLIRKTRFIVRKCAHFTLYFTLGILVYLILSTYNLKSKIIISIIICLSLASIDEFHQLFSPGRTARLYDVLIDTVASAISIFLTHIISRKKNNHH